MGLGTLIVVGVVALALLGIWLLPLRKRWNDDGAADRARAKAAHDDSVDQVAEDEPAGRAGGR